MLTYFDFDPRQLLLEKPEARRDGSLQAAVSPSVSSVGTSQDGFEKLG